MQTLADIAVFCVALLHLCFLMLEMILWNRKSGRRLLGLDAEFARSTRRLAANQGLYNGFLAAGLLWSLLDEQFAWPLQLFFLSCVIIAGIFGALSVNRQIIWIQALPGAIALVLVFLAQSTY
ncbi:MAG: DUF1304 domain-containing protein [Thiotrichales bacterium]|nr:MAG: DUF1304 domain-containing protein [Thiotrichales bacterium]